MLAAILANLQNVEPARTAKLPRVDVDRGGGGPSWPSYDIVDIMAAIQLFPEVAGEDPVARAARRRWWIGEALPFVKEARERREASAFLAGAAVADAAAEERHRASDAAAEERRKLVDQLKIEQLVEIIDDVRGIAMPVPRQSARGAGTSPVAIAVAVAIGVGIGVALGRTSSVRRRKR